MNKIYCFIQSEGSFGVTVTALADDGDVLAGHLSSHKLYAMHDIGMSSNRKHDIYEKHFPNGYELEWLDDPLNHEGFKAAYELNQQIPDEQ